MNHGDNNLDTTVSPVHNVSSLLDLQTQDCSVSFEEESTAKFVCNVCKKTFYNENALRNHKNMQHDIYESSSEGEARCNFSSKAEQNVNGIVGFKFIPLSKGGEFEHSVVDDGLTTRTFTEDTSFLIVTVEGDDSDPDGKRSDISRKGHLRSGKQPVDLRGPFTCSFPLSLGPDLQCHQIFFNCCEYSLHYREEHTKRRKAALRCQVCEKRLDRNPSHPIAPQVPVPTLITFSCRICGQTFLDSAKYDEHNAIVHAKIKPHQCSVCAKRFTQQGGLQQHMRMHTGIRPFTCTFCPKAFTQKAGLDQHLRTHTKVKPFKCVICTKSFSQSVHLRQHMRTHTNIQPFECAVCARRFKQSSHLNFHMRSHISEVESGGFVVEQYFGSKLLNLANLQPVQDGETIYYAAEVAGSTDAQF